MKAKRQASVSHLVKKGRKYDLTSYQLGIWFYYKLSPEDNSYNTFANYHIKGNLDMDRFLYSVLEIINFFPSYRTNYGEDKTGKPFQIIDKKYDLDVIEYIDLTQNSEISKGDLGENFAYARKKLDEYNYRPINLLNDSPQKFLVIKIDSKNYYFSVTQHHINADGYSAYLGSKAIAAVYNRGVSALEDFKDYSVEDYFGYLAKISQSEKREKIDFWQKELAKSELRFDFPKKNVGSIPAFIDEVANVSVLDSAKQTNKKLRFFLGKNLGKSLHALSRQRRTTFFLTIMSVWAIMLKRVYNNSNFHIGYAIDSRPSELKQIYGDYVSILPFNFNIDAKQKYSDFLTDVTKQRKAHKQHEDVSLIDSVLTNRSSSSPEVIDFNVTVSQASFFSDFLKLDGVESSSIATSGAFVGPKQDLSLAYDPATENFEVIINYNPELFDSDDVVNLKTYFVNLLEDVCLAPEKRICDLRLLPKEHYKILTSGFENKEIEVDLTKTVSQEFSEIAQKYPNNIAIKDGEREITYRDLDELTNRVSLSLRQYYKQENEIVALYSERSLDYVVMVLSVLKSGGAFLPISSGTPEQRIRTIIEDSGAALLLRSNNLQQLSITEKGDFKQLAFSDIFTQSNKENIKEYQDLSKPDDLAYVIYTSGSTGVPKGVMIRNVSLQNNIQHFIRKYSVEASKNTIFKTNIAFDVAMQEMFSTILSGAKLLNFPIEDETEMYNLVSFVSKEKINFLQFTPAQFSMFLSEIRDHSNISNSLEYVVVGGDALSIKIIHDFLSLLPNAKLVNAYGPTEITIDGLHNVCAKQDDDSYLGSSISNTKFYILDENLKPVSFGSPGQLCLSGIGVAEGYLNNSEKTKLNFIKNPYSNLLEKYDLLYLTGDLVKIDSDLNVSFLGRIDDQVKIRGYRIELGEIEVALSNFPEIKEARLLAQTRNNNPDDKYLIAYYLSDVELDAYDLKSYLAESLPAYMIPNYFVRLDEFPLTKNGKLDKKALVVIDLVEDKKEIISPSSKLEASLLEIWSSLLDLNANDISVEGSFFDIGGHSLKAIELSHRISKDLNYVVTVKDIFTYSDIRSLASYLSQREQKNYEEIFVVEEAKYYKASQAQKRLYLINQIKGDNQDISFNMPVVLELKGKYDLAKLENALKEIFARHSSFRTSFFLEGEDLYQEIHNDIEFRITKKKFKPSISESELKANILSLVKLFDLAKAPLIRASLISVGSQRDILFIDMHHIISDGLSYEVFFAELSALYKGEDLSPLAIEYKDYANWHNLYLDSALLEKKKSYWLNKFSDEIEPLILPYDFIRPRDGLLQSSEISFSISADLTKKVKSFCNKHNITEYLFYLSCYAYLLKRYSNQKSINVGTSVSGRNHPQTKDLIGFFVNMLSLHIDFSKGKSILSYLKEVKTEFLESFDNQDYPFDSLVDDLELVRDVSRHPIFDVFFSFDRFEANTLSVDDGFSLENISIKNAIAKFDLSLNCYEECGVHNFILEYAENLFSSETISRISSHFQNIISNIVELRDINDLSEVNIFSEAEYNLLTSGFENKEVEVDLIKTVSQEFSEIAKKYPNHIAIKDGDIEITYRDLDELTSRVSLVLGQYYKQENEIIALYSERSLDYVVMVLSVLKSGGAFLPISSGTPEQRIETIIENSGAALLLRSNNLQQLSITEKSDFKQLVFSDIFTQSQKETLKKYQDLSKPENLAYVIYTSGSTGVPKGVMIRNVSLQNNIQYFIDLYGVEPGSSVLFKTSITFDIVYKEVFLSLLSGSVLVNHNEMDDFNSNKLCRVIQDNQVSFAQFTPTQLFAFLLHFDSDEYVLDCLNYVIVGGEALSLDMVSSFFRHFPKVNLFNVYGPTEATIWVSTQLISPESKSVFVGSTISNTKFYVLDEGMQPVPFGAIGQLCISGICLAQGYLNDDKKTQSSFLENPYSFAKKQYELLYLSGDLVKIDSNYNLTFVGRADDQLKIRGYRVELGEVESILSDFEGINSVKVVSRNDERDFDDKYLVAYYLSDVELDTNDLKSYLAESLPAYMIPNYFVRLDKFPLTSNGKLDKKALAVIDLVEDKNEVISPANKLEASLLEVWSSLLDLKANSISIEDSFFDIGGHSLKAIELSHKISKDLSYEVTVKDIFTYSDIRSLASYLSQREQKNYEEIFVVEEAQYYKASQAQKRLYLINQIKGDNQGVSFNMPLALELKGKYDLAKLENALKEIFARHSSFRTSFFLEGEDLYQEIHNDIEFRITKKKFKPSISESELKANILSLVKLFDLAKAPLIRASLISVGSQRDILFIDMHHIISDGLSYEVFFAELPSLYQGEDLSPLAIEYKDYANWHNNYLDSALLEKQKSYWLNKFSAEIEPLILPYDFTRSRDGLLQSAEISFSISGDLTNKVKSFCNKHNITEYLFYLSCYAYLLKRYSNQKSVNIGTPVSGRNHPQTKDLIGFFVNMLSLHIDFSKDKSILSYLKEVKAEFLESFDNQDYPFDALVDDLELVRDVSRHPIFDVFFSFDRFERDLLLVDGDFSLEDIGLKNALAKFDLSLNCYEEFGAHNFVLEYAKNLFSYETISRISSHFQNIISNIVDISSSSSISEVNIFSEAEYNLLTSGFENKEIEVDLSKTVSQEFSEIAKKYPNDIAIKDGDREITYHDLDELTSRVSLVLRQYYHQENEIVALYSERSLDYVVMVLSILKSGGAFLPISSKTPEKRISTILESSKSLLLLRSNNLQELGTIVKKGCNQLLFSELLAQARQVSLNVYKDLSKPENLAYVIYTSGSTGVPKGVMIKNVSLENNIQSFIKSYNINSKDVNLFKANISFDVSLHTIFSSLSSGHKLVIFPENRDYDLEFLSEISGFESINILQFSPSQFRAFLDSSVVSSNKEKYRYFFIGGEAISKELCQKSYSLFPNTKIINSYGPSECTIDVLQGLILSDNINDYLGKTVANTKIYILNDSLKPVPFGTPGQLCISGLSLAKGYLNDLVRTNESFIKNPFCRDGHNYQDLYFSGDLVRLDKDQNISFLGRIDDQVKVRGFRIETGEIEMALSAHDAINVAKVFVQKLGNGSSDTDLVAYYTGKLHLKSEKLRSFLLRSLPDYMVPNYFVKLTEFPFNKNGKIDRENLERHIFTERCGENKIIFPRNNYEKKLVNIWSGLTSFAKSQISVDRNLFDMGGNSLKLISLHYEIIKKFSVDFGVERLFLTPYIEQIAELITENKSDYSENLITIKEFAEADKNLYLIHSPTGSNKEMIFLASQLNINANIYALKPSGFNLNNIEDLAAYYHKIILSHANDNEIILCGWSFSGVLAYQIYLFSIKQNLDNISRVIIVDADVRGEEKGLSYDEEIDYIFKYILNDEEVRVSRRQKLTLKKAKSFLEFVSLLRKEKIIHENEIKALEDKKIHYEYYLNLQSKDKFERINSAMMERLHFILARENIKHEQMRKFIEKDFSKSKLNVINADHFSIVVEDVKDISKVISDNLS